VKENAFCLKDLAATCNCSTASGTKPDGNKGNGASMPPFPLPQAAPAPTTPDSIAKTFGEFFLKVHLRSPQSYVSRDSSFVQPWQGLHFQSWYYGTMGAPISSQIQVPKLSNASLYTLFVAHMWTVHLLRCHFDFAMTMASSALVTLLCVPDNPGHDDRRHKVGLPTGTDVHVQQWGGADWARWPTL